MKRTVLSIAAAIGLLAFIDVGVSRAANSFSDQILLTPSRVWQAAAPLPEGEVLVVGGIDSDADVLLSSTIVFDPLTDTFSSTGPMATGRALATATPLADGRVLVAGGTDGHPIQNPVSSAELYDPSSGTFSPTGSMNQIRLQHSATDLANGKVLLIGGGDGSGALATAEIYDPDIGTFSPTGSMSMARRLFSATMLADGRVLVAGGVTDASDDTNLVEIYDPLTGTFAASGTLLTARSEHTASLLPDGRVLITGGSDVIPDVDPEILNSSEIFDPATGTSTPAASMALRRSAHSATALPGGKILMAGGFGGSAFPLAAEIYDPGTGQFTLTASIAEERYEHDAVPLPNGRVLLVAGNGAGRYSAEIFTYDPLDEVVVPAPVSGKRATFSVVKGKVSVRCKGQKNFTRLIGRESIRVGCEVDTRTGSVRLTSAKGKVGTQSAVFRGGIFRWKQKPKQTEVEVVLTGPRNCGATRQSLSFSPGGSDASTSALRGRRIWGNGKGRFKSSGSRGSGSVRGTEWLTEDRCNGTTFFRVKSGVVAVRDFAKKKTIRLKAGKSYVAGKKKRRR